ncbi:MAG: hypothetical protein ACK2U3_08945 [Anaerolineales bacterium]|jgi:hypothetical protein
MAETSKKPLNWEPAPDIGYTVERRKDGGLKVVFSDVNERTLDHWRGFALSHLIDSDRLTRNLYDLRQIEKLPEEAIQYAVEVNNDPSVRNIRLAVVVSNDDVQNSVKKIQALTSPGGVEMAVFTDIAKAEEWLQRPLTMIV